MKNSKPSFSPISSKPSTTSYQIHHHKPPPSSSSSNPIRKSQWESSAPDQASTPSDSKPPRTNPNPNPNPNMVNPHASSSPSLTPGPSAKPNNPPPPLPNPMIYGLHNLERRAIVLADGTFRSYFALPSDYPMEPQLGLGLGLGPPGFREPPLLSPSRDYGRAADRDYWPSLGLDGPSSSLKRLPEDPNELSWHGNPNPNQSPLPSTMRSDHHGEDSRASKQVKLERGSTKDLPTAGKVDPQALKRAFLRLSKAVNENLAQKKNYLQDGKIAPLQCIVCGRDSKEFTDVHKLILHAYNAHHADLRVDHLGLHKALCVLMGWNYAKQPDNSKAYQSLSADEASANREDLIVWPPAVIIHNTSIGRQRLRTRGRMKGLSNKKMDLRLKELGFAGGKSRSMYGEEGHLGFTVVKFANTQAGLEEAERLADFFEKQNHGRKGWARAEASKSDIDDEKNPTTLVEVGEKNPTLVEVDEKNGEIFYAYLATASDIEKLDFYMMERASIKSRKEFDLSD